MPVPSSTYHTYGTAKYWSTTVPWRLRYNTTLCLYSCLRTVLMVLPSTGSTTVPWWRLRFRCQRELLRYSCCACTIVYVLYSWCCQVLGRVRTTTVPWRLPYNTVPVLYLLPGTSTPVPGTVLIIRDWKIVITDTGYQIPTVFYRPNTVILKYRGIRLPT